MKFEEFLVRHKVFLNALGHSKGSRTRPLESIMQMYRIVFDELCTGITDDMSIVEKLQAHPNLKALTSPLPVPEEDQEPPRKRFSAAVVRAKVVQRIRDGRDRCPVCGARLPPSYRSKDHTVKQELGGMGELENLEFTHPFCNSARDAILAKKQELSLT